MVFLYMSIDTDINKWKKFLAKKINMGGIYAIQSNRQKDDFIWNLYGM